MVQIQESGEMYLETILVLTEKSKYVRSIDVCEHMGFSKPSVSRAIGILKNAGYVRVDGDGYLSLTDEGEEIARKMYDRHRLLTRFLTSLGVSEACASEDACKIEHRISDESFEAIKRFVGGQND
ncbi:MAG: metal-dependent transcriptional regulator [Clostridia bacterium]|nr:metal-dependent transcriptional regulator [Clostridia bacterium]